MTGILHHTRPPAAFARPGAAAPRPGTCMRARDGLPFTRVRPRLLAPVFAALIAAAAATGCRPPDIQPPYAEGQAPPPAQLLGAAQPKISALQVPVAKIRIGRAPAGNLMFLAQKPGRFSGQIQIAGHEFVSLAFHERGYTLRNVAADTLPAGFFAGPPADCAIRRLLGVPFAAPELVSLVLGGAPVIGAPYEVVGQSWDPRHGHEVLRLRTPTFEQELRFAFVSGAWWPAGGTLWQRRADGTLTRMWSLLHEGLHPVAGTVLPSRTRLAGNSTRRQDLVIITYNQQTVDPDLGDSSAAATGEDEAGWEDEDTAAGEAAPDEEGAAPTEGAAAAEGAAPKAAAQPVSSDTSAPAGAIPPQFTLDGAGLAARGDLCH